MTKIEAGMTDLARLGLGQPNRRAVIFQFEVPAEQFRPGTYTCQINIIDAASGTFAFPRLAFYVK